MNYLFIIVLATTSLICSDGNYRGPVSPNRTNYVAYLLAQKNTKHLIKFLMSKKMYQDKNHEYESLLLSPGLLTNPCTIAS